MKYYIWLFSAPTAPRNFKLTVESSTSIKATWTEPLKVNGVFKRYVLLSGQLKDGLNRRVYTKDTEYLLISLEEFTDYVVQVYAETAVSGLSSITLQEKTLEDG